MHNDAMYDRSRALIPVETRQLRVLVCGAGMGGSWVTAALARMVAEVVIVDHDVVEMVNVGVQQYTPADVGLTKVEATAKHNAGLNVLPVFGRMEARMGAVVLRDNIAETEREYNVSQWDVVVSAVDSMSGRKWLAEQCRDAGVRLFIDGRTMGEMVCILAAMPGGGQQWPSYERYLSTILPDEEVEEATCGAEGTVYSGMFFAMRAATVVNNWARGMNPKAKEVWHVATMDLLDAEDFEAASSFHVELLDGEESDVSEEEAGQEGGSQEGWPPANDHIEAEFQERHSSLEEDCSHEGTCEEADCWKYHKEQDARQEAREVGAHEAARD